MDCNTRIRVLDGPHAGRHTLFLGMGLSEDGERYEIARIGGQESELCMLRSIAMNKALEEGWETGLEYAKNIARRWHVHSYKRVPTKWYQRDAYTYEGTYSLRVVERASGIDIIRGAKILPIGPVAPIDVRLSGLWNDHLTAIESIAQRFSAAVAILETGPIREHAEGAARAVEASVVDARRLAALGTQLGEDLTDERVERVLEEMVSLQHMVDEALSEAVELHLSVREGRQGAYDELGAAAQLRAITAGSREARN